MLLLALTALVMPAVYELVVGGGLPAPDAERVNFGSTVEHLSLAVAIVLIFSYVSGPGLLAEDPPVPCSTPPTRRRRPAGASAAA